MIAYLDSSVVLSIILRQSPRLVEWDYVEIGVASVLLHIECFRALDVLWHRRELTEQELALTRAEVSATLGRLTILAIDEHVVEVASRPLPTSLATLDSIHLASAMLFRDAQPPDEPPIVFATHDHKLAQAARAMNFRVIGA